MKTIWSVVLVCVALLASGGCQKKSKEGESCASSADCESGFRCLQQTCVALSASGVYQKKSKEGQSCAGAEHCAGDMVCIGLKCCQPNCGGKECGDDGCNGSCGKCKFGWQCNANQQCFDPCTGKECGDDGYGRSCGECKSGWQCNANHQCFNPCDGKECGDDGYGRSCGKCESSLRCSNNKCVTPCTGKQCGDDGHGGSCGTCGDCRVCKESQCANVCWLDRASGLTCQITPTGGKIDWSDAKAHCAGLDLGGHTDWHLPTISELRTLIRGCPGTATGGVCKVTDSCLSRLCWDKGACWNCSYGDGPADGCYWPDEMQGTCSWYWSSSPVEDGANGAWGVAFDTGSVPSGYVYNDKHVRCVRDAP